MRLSRLLGRTYRQPPAEAQLPSHQLLVRAGFLRPVEGGSFAHLPLGHRTLRRLQGLARRELARLDAQEVTLPQGAIPSQAPAAKPASQEAQAGTTARLVELVGLEVDSYRQLPLLVFQIGHRAAPSGGMRSGPFGAGERPTVEISTFTDAALQGDEQALRALAAILAACRVPALWASAGEGVHRAYFLHPAGDEEVAYCPACGYAAQRPWAATAWPIPPQEAELPPEEVDTPGCDTIAILASFLDIPASRTLKMVFYSVEGRVTCAVIRGDRKIDEHKLARLLGTSWYYTSLEEELAQVGAVGGYASPIGLDPQRLRVVADFSVRSGTNFVSGANRPDTHIRNVNVPRDFDPDEWADLALVEAGDPCPGCGAALQVEPGFALVEGIAACPIAAEYRDEEGQARPLWVACWHLDLGRLMAATVEAHHDGYGIVWPAACAPFDVLVVGLDLREEAVQARAEELYGRLLAGGFAVLYDDRDASAGVKFNDADLIGVPLRLTASKRWLADGRIEAKWRDSSERLKLDEEGLAGELARLRDAVDTE